MKSMRIWVLTKSCFSEDRYFFAACFWWQWQVVRGIAEHLWFVCWSFIIHAKHWHQSQIFVKAANTQDDFFPRQKQFWRFLLSFSSSSLQQSIHRCLACKAVSMFPQSGNLPRQIVKVKRFWLQTTTHCKRGWSRFWAIPFGVNNYSWAALAELLRHGNSAELQLSWPEKKKWRWLPFMVRQVPLHRCRVVSGRDVFHVSFCEWNGKVMINYGVRGEELCAYIHVPWNCSDQQTPTVFASAFFFSFSPSLSIFGTHTHTHTLSLRSGNFEFVSANPEGPRTPNFSHFIFFFFLLTKI